MADVDPLHDGLLLTKADQLRVQTAEWTILVVIDNPVVDPELLRSLTSVIDRVKWAMEKGVITKYQHNSWLGRLGFLKSYLETHQVSQTPHNRRIKRGWFDIVGRIGSTLFGLATSDSIEECRKAISEARGNQHAIVHQVNKLTTVLNRTQQVAAWNQKQISQVTNFISEKLIPKLNMALTQANYTARRILRVERAFYFERVVSTLEHITGSCIQSLQRYARQKASLEMGRLTEDIMSPAQLHKVLRLATTASTYPIDPIQWYYEHSHVYPVWGQETLIYRVKLPLVDGRSYNRYNLASWPVPYEKEGYSIQIKVEQRDVGISTVNGDIFHPVGCLGWKPMVCRSGPLFDTNRWSCPRTLIAGDRKRSHNCQVVLTQQSNLTQVTEISFGEYVVVTWGETLETHCQGKPSSRQKVHAGAYLVTVPSGCVVVGKGVTLTGIIERIGHVSVGALRVLTTSILNITDIIPEEQALSLLSQPHFDKQTPTLLTDLTPLSLPPPSFSWAQHGSKLSVGLLLTLIILIALLVVVGYVAWRKRELVISWLHSRMKTNTEPALTSPEQSSQVLTSPSLPQHPTYLYPFLTTNCTTGLGEQNHITTDLLSPRPPNEPLQTAETEII